MFTPPPPCPEEPSGQQVAAPTDIHAYIVDCLNRGSKPAEVRKQLVVLGYSAQEANQLVQAAQRPGRPVSPYGYDHGRSPQSNMLIGGLIFSVGLLVTLGTMASGGGQVIIAYGAIIWGAIQFFRGLAASSQE